MRGEDEDLLVEEAAVQELEARFDVLETQMIDLQRKLAGSNRGLQLSKDFEGNRKLRSELIEVLNQMASLSLQLGNLGKRYAEEAAYHREMLKNKLDEPRSDKVIIDARAAAKDALKRQL